MRILLTSDLHIDSGDYGKLVAKLLPGYAAEINPQVLVIAGDVSAHLDQLQHTLQAFSNALSCPKLFVPGNHDIWVARSNRTIDSWIKYDELLPRVCEVTGFHYLPGSPLTIQGVGFAGTIGWYDYSLRNKELDSVIKPEDYVRKRYRHRTWNDKHYARWGRSDEEVVQEFARRLDRDLSTFDGASIPVVCVTHHLPFSELLIRTGEPQWDYFAAFMGSEALGDIIRRHPSVKYVLAGHAHRPKDRLIDGIHVITAPIGYSRDIKGDPEDHLRESLRLIELP